MMPRIQGLLFLRGGEFMAHTIEPAASGRTKCRGCGEPIAKGELGFGERLPHPFADDGDMTLRFHILCAANKRQESIAEFGAMIL